MHEPIADYRSVPLPFHPRTGSSELILRKVAHLRGGEWAAKTRHPAVPCFFTHHGEALDVLEVPGIPFDILPESAGVPAVKIMHRHQDADFPVLSDHLLEVRDKPFVIFAAQL